MAVITDLPEEILGLICDHIRKTSTIAEFKNCLLCCKTWHGLWLPLLYRDVSLHNSNFAAFCAAENTQYLHHIRSLTINVWPPGCTEEELDHIDSFIGNFTALSQAKTEMRQNGGVRTQSLWKTLSRLPDTVARLENLQSLSFEVADCSAYSADEVDGDPDQGFFMPNSLLSRCLDALPSSCTNLNLDTRGYNSQRQSEEETLRQSLRRLTPQLTRLRLRIAAFDVSALGLAKTMQYDAREMAHPVSTQLEKLILDTGYSPFIGGPCCTQLDGDTVDSARTSADWDSARWQLKDNILKSQLRQAFPSLFECTIVEDLDHSPREGVDKLSYSGIYLRDLIGMKSTAFPFWLLRMRSQQGEHDLYALRTNLAAVQNRIGSDSGITDLVGPFSSLHLAAQGSPWPEVANRCKLPNTLARSQGWRILDDLQYRSTHDWDVVVNGSTCELWEKEKRGRSELLQILETEGVWDNSPLQARAAEPPNGCPDAELDLGGLFD